MAETESAQASQAKNWLKGHGKDAGVQLLAARAAARDGNFAKALEHARNSEQARPSAAARSEIARAEQATGANSAGASDVDELAGQKRGNKDGDKNEAA